MRSSWSKYLFFAALYFIQGATLAYIITFQKPYLSSQGVSTEMLGLYTSSLLLPFILKVFLGMLSDRLPFGRWGGRKPYMILGLAIFALSYAILTRVAPGAHFHFFWLLTWLASFGLALFDTCADGWAIDVAEESEQSPIQAAMVAGKAIGLIVMSFFFGWIVLVRGVGPVFAILAGMAAAMTAIVLAVPTPGRRIAALSENKTEWARLFTFAFAAFAIYGVIYSVASFGTDGLLALQLSQERLLGPVALGSFGVARGIGSLAGALLYARVSARLGLSRAQYLALFLLGFGCWLPLSMTLPAMWLGFFWGTAWGFQETAFVTLSMRLSEGRWAATFFAICMIFSNVGTSLGEVFGGQFVTRFGFDNTFMIFSLVAWVSLLFVRPALHQAATSK